MNFPELIPVTFKFEVMGIYRIFIAGGSGGGDFISMLNIRNSYLEIPYLEISISRHHMYYGNSGYRMS